MTNIQVIVIDGTEHNVIIIESNVTVVVQLLFYSLAVFSFSNMTLTSQIVQRFLTQALSWDSYPMQAANFLPQYRHANSGC